MCTRCNGRSQASGAIPSWQALTPMIFACVKVMVARKHQLQKFVKRWGAVVLRRGLSAWVSAIRQLKQQQKAVAESQERIRLMSLQSAFDRQASSSRLSSGLIKYALILLPVHACSLLIHNITEDCG